MIADRRIERDEGCLVALAPLHRERAHRHCAVDRDRDVDRPLRAEEREQQHRAGEAGGAGAERVDVVEQPDRASDLTRAANEMRDQHRQRRAHQQGRHDHERQGDDGGQRQRQAERQVAYPVEDGERNEAEGRRSQLR